MSDTLSSIYHFICWMATISFSIFWAYNYCLNEDLCSVDFKHYYENKKDITPMLSLCLQNPFSEQKFKEVMPYNNISTYVKFLRGEHFNSTWMEVDYQSVIKNISDYVERDSIKLRNGSKDIPIHPFHHSYYPEYSNSKSYANLGFNANLGRVHAISIFWGSNIYNCYGLSIPNVKDFENIWFRIKNNIFPDGIRSEKYSLLTIIHYPNQMLYSQHILKYAWPQTRQKNESYLMRFKIGMVEVVRRRQKDSHQCNENWEDYDNEIMKSHIEKIGCRPLYFSPLLGSSNAPVCSTRDQMKRAKFDLQSDGYGVLPPCSSMEEISYDNEESSIDPMSWKLGEEGTFFKIGLIFFNRNFKDILQTR